MFDILIRNATIVDGTGSDPFVGHIGITGEKIAAVLHRDERGSLTTFESAREIIDAAGLLAMPGFVDVHGHSDFNLLVCPSGDSKLRQGITTEIIGNCGESAFPLFGPYRESVLVELKWLGIEPRWRTAEQYFTFLDAIKPSYNVASFVGHNSVRAAVVGYSDERPTDQQLQQMRNEVRIAMEAGAIGFTTGLVYPPGMFAETEELAILQKEAAIHGGCYASHVRSEGDLLLQAADEFLEVISSTDSRGQFSHLKASGPRNWGKVVHVLSALEDAIARGANIWWDKYPYVASSTSLASLLPAWVLAGGTDPALSRLRDPSDRDSILNDVEENNEGKDGWDSVLIVDAGCDEYREIQGESLGAAARQLGMSPRDLFIELLCTSRLRTAICNFTMNWEETDLVILHPRGMVCTDSACRAPSGVLSRDCPHPRAYGSFGAFFRRYVKELGKLTLSQAVQKVTSLPCSIFGLKSRGELRPGYYADILLLRWEEFRDAADFTAPHQFCPGIETIIVNGTVSVRQGVSTNRRGGRVLRRSGDRIE